MQNDWWHSATALAVAGALGGVVRWLTFKERWQDGLISIVVGAICAVYVTPWTVSLLNVPASEQATNLAAFVTGVGGIGVVGFLIQFWRIWREKGAGK